MTRLANTPEHPNVVSQSHCLPVSHADYGDRHARPLRLSSAAEPGGPQPPAGYGSGGEGSADQPSRMGLTKRHAASSSSLRMKSVESPRRTSSSNRSYASGSAVVANPLSYAKSICTG